MRLVIRGHHLPGLDHGDHHNVHVGIQLGSEPADLVPADRESAVWTVVIDTTGDDFRGPAVQGRRGSRFVYLTWGTLADGTFSMFRRAKLMLDDLPAGVPEVTVDVHLTDDCGWPRCARLKPPAVEVRAG